MKYDPSTPRTGPVPHEIIQKAGVTAALVWAEIEGMEHGYGKKDGEWVDVRGGNAAIAKRFGVTQRTVQVAVTTLKSMGYLESKKTVQGSLYRTVKQIHWCKNDINEDVKKTSMEESFLHLHRCKNDTNNTTPLYPQLHPTTPREETATQSHSLSKDEAPAARLPEEDEIQNTQHADPSTVERDHAVERGDAPVVFSQEPQGEGKGQSPTLTVPLRDPVRSTARARAVQPRERNPGGLKEAQAILEQARREKAFQNN